MVICSFASQALPSSSPAFGTQNFGSHTRSLCRHLCRVLPTMEFRTRHFLFSTRPLDSDDIPRIRHRAAVARHPLQSRFLAAESTQNPTRTTTLQNPLALARARAAMARAQFPPRLRNAPLPCTRQVWSSLMSKNPPRASLKCVRNWSASSRAATKYFSSNAVSYNASKPSAKLAKSPKYPFKRACPSLYERFKRIAFSIFDF